MTSPAQWHPDPTGRHQLRYWDGSRWTDHVSTNGQAGVDSIAGIAPTVNVGMDAEKIQAQVNTSGYRGAGISNVGQGGGTIFTEPILVVNQKAKLIEVVNQYAVFNAQGQQIASVNEIGQSAAKKVLRVVSSLDQFMTHKLEVRDALGQVQLVLTRPRKFVKSSVIVADGSGQELGRIVQENMIGKIHFGLESGGRTVGSLRAENWRAWNFRIEDHTGTEVARITKTFEGFAKALFTDADNYVVQLHGQIPQPLLNLVIASALSVDTALKQASG
jgi:Scramblase/Protein of unknown function (DUF2510)